MMYWAGIFLLISVVAAFFGFGPSNVSTSDLAQNLSYIFITFFVISLIAGVVEYRRTKHF